MVLAETMGATLVQRHPNGSVRIVGTEFGVLRWDGLTWHHEPPIGSWIDAVAACGHHGDRDVIEILLEFAVHDLGARGIGAILLYRPDAGSASTIEVRLPPPPPLDVRRPSDLAPLRHALAQIDGAAVIDHDGILRELGVRLVPSPEAESTWPGCAACATRRAAATASTTRRRPSIVISEDGPVTVLRERGDDRPLELTSARLSWRRTG